MPTPAEIRAELDRRKRAASAPVQAPAPVAPVSNADAIRAELARRKSAAPAPMSQPDATPWGDGQAFDDMYARKPQTDPMLSPLMPGARTLTSGQPTRMKPPPAPRGPVMSPVQRQAMAPERAAAEAERRAAQERREAASAFGGGMDMLPTMDTGGNVRPGTDIDRDIGAGITGTVSGIRPLNALSNTVEAAANLPGDVLQSVMGGERVIPRADIPSVPLPKELESVTGDLSQGIMQFLMARGVIGKAAPGGGMAAQAGKDAAAIFAGFDSDTPRMAETLAADFMRENGMGWMADRDPNNPLMERVKNGIEEMFLAYAPVEAVRRTPQAVDAITGVGRLPNTPTNAGGANLAPSAPPVAPVAPTQPQTATAPPVPPNPPNAPAVTAGAPMPGPAGQVPPAGQLTPVSNLGPAEQAFNNLPMKTRESMLNAFQSAGVTPDRAKAMIGELNNLPDGQNTMYALEVMRRNGLSDADIDGVLIAMGREFATESPRPAGRVFNREQDSARQIMNDQVRTQINSEGRSITDVAERNFGEGVVPAGEALDLELDQLSNAYETILSTKRSPTGRLRSPAKKDAVYKAREDLTNALVSPEVMQTIPQDVKLQIMMQASDDMRRLKFTPDELGLILQGDGAVLAPLFNGYGALSWSPDLWSHLARQYPTQAAHSLQSALRKAADEAFRRGDATAGRYYKRLRGESGKGGLLDTLERAVPKYKETRVQFGDASSAKEALDILERFKAAAASEGDVAKIIKDLEGLPQRHREMAEQQITSIIRQELARKVESPRLAELGQTVAQTPNLTSLSRQDFLKALEDVFGPRGKELADAIRAARARTDTLTSISPKYNSRTELNRQDVQNAPALYEAPGSLEGGIIDAGVKRLGTVAGGASLIPGGQGAALALGAATAVQAAMNAARRGKRLSNAERNALVDFLFKSRTAGDAAPPVATRGPSMGDYAQAIGRDAVIGAGVGAVADGDPLNNDPMALIGGALGGAAGYGRARIRNARSLIKPPPAPRGAGRRNPPPAGPAVPPPVGPRPLPGQTSNSPPMIGGAALGALTSGGATYAATGDEDAALKAGILGGIGGGVVGTRFGKGAKPKAPAAAKPKPAFDQRFMKEAQRLVSYNGGVDKALKAQQYVIDQLKNSKAVNAEDRLNRAVSIQYAIRRMAEKSNRDLDEIVPMADAAPTGPKPIDPSTNYNIDPRGDKFVIRTDAGEEVLGAPAFTDRKQALAWLQGETRKARQGSAAPKPRSGPPASKPPPKGQKAPPKGPPGTLSRMVAGGAVGGLAGSLGGDANAQEDLTAEMASTKKDIDDLNAALKEWDSLDVLGKQRLLIKLGRVQSTYVNAKGQRVKFDDGNTGDRTEPLFKAYADEKRAALAKAEAGLEALKKQNAYRQFQKEQNPFYDAVRELGPSGAGILAGVAAGVLRYRAVGKSAKAAKAIEDDINDLLTTGPVKGLMKKGGADNKLRNRAVNMKDFYRKGGAAEDDLPFKYGPQGWKANPKPAKPGSLYSPKTTTKMDGVGSQFLRAGDIKLIGAGVLDSAMVRPFVADAEEELKKAQEDVENGNESIEALRRVEKAKTNLAMYQAIERIGWGLAATGALGAAYRYKLPKPDIRGAEDEVTAIADYLKSIKPARTPRTPKALPPPPAPQPPPVAAPSSQLLLPLLPPPPAPPKPKPKPKKP